MPAREQRTDNKHNDQWVPSVGLFQENLATPGFKKVDKASAVVV
jgi:hypothetical protein